MKDDVKLFRLAVLTNAKRNKDLWVEDRRGGFKACYIPSESSEDEAVFSLPRSKSMRIRIPWSEYYNTWRCWTDEPSWIRRHQVDWYDMEHCSFKKGT